MKVDSIGEEPHDMTRAMTRQAFTYFSASMRDDIGLNATDAAAFSGHYHTSAYQEARASPISAISYHDAPRRQVPCQSNFPTHYFWPDNSAVFAGSAVTTLSFLRLTSHAVSRRHAAPPLKVSGFDSSRSCERFSFLPSSTSYRAPLIFSSSRIEPVCFHAPHATPPLVTGRAKQASLRLAHYHYHRESLAD